MKKIRLLVCFTALCFMFAGMLFAVLCNENIVVKGIRPMGMGGAFTAVSDDENSFFYNPAGISSVLDNTLQIFSVNIGINKHIFDGYNLYTTYKDCVADNVKTIKDDTIASIDDIYLGELYKSILALRPNIFISAPNAFFIKNPIDIGRNSLNFGIGFFSYTKTYLEFSEKTILPSLSYNAEVTGIGVLPVAFRIHSLKRIKLPGVISLGVNFKYAYRITSSKQNLSVNEIGSYAFDENIFDATAFGLDFGTIYSLNSRWHFGINMIDLYNSQFNYKKNNILKEDNDDRSKDNVEHYRSEIKTIVNVGFSYIPEKLYFWPGKYLYTNGNITWAFDLTDITNPLETIALTPFKKIHMGTEYRLSVISLRTGLNSGYPSFGAGLKLNHLNLEYSFYGHEKGLLSGQDPDWIHSFMLSFRLKWSGHLPIKSRAICKLMKDVMYYKRKAKYAWITASDLRKMKILEEENRKLKQLLSEQEIDIKTLQEINRKN